MQVQITSGPRLLVQHGQAIVETRNPEQIEEFFDQVKAAEAHWEDLCLQQDLAEGHTE